MIRMKQLSVLVCALVMALAVGGGAAAQMLPPGSSQFNPPPPPPPPPPKIEVPEIPKMDAPPKLPRVQAAPRGSFSDRISRCLDEAAAAGLGPNARASYSRACANR